MKIKSLITLLLALCLLLAVMLCSCNREDDTDNTSSNKESSAITETESESEEQSSNTEIAVEGISLNKNELSVEVGASKTLLAIIYPSNASDKSVVFSSSDESIATVSASGKVTGVREGKVTITATSSNGKSSSCEVTIIKENTYPTSIKLDRTTANISVSGGITLVATLSPDGVLEDEIVWTSSDTSIVIVLPGGTVLGNSDGTATVTATTVNGLKATCKVVVGAGSPISDIQITGGADSINAGKTLKLAVTTTPANASLLDLTWSSSDTSVLTVDSTGTVRAVGVGTATITATTKNGVTDEITIAVTEAETISVELYLEDKLFTTLYTSYNENYKVTLPHPTDITTDSEVLKYFTGWYKTDTFTGVVTSDSSFTTSTKLYGEMLDVDVSAIKYTITDNKITITGYEGTAPSTLVIPSHINNVPVVAIGDEAFYNNDDITNVIICEGIKSIGSKAFFACYNLYNISVPSSIEELGATVISSWATNFRTNLWNNINYIGNSENPYLIALSIDSAYNDIKLSIHKDCKLIAQNALRHSNVCEIVVEDGNEYFCAEDGILYDKNKTKIIEIAVKLNKAIEIPKTVVSIPEGILSGVSFTTISVEEGNTAYVCDCGILYDIGKTNILCAPKALEGKVIIPSTVTSIEGNDFYGCYNITEIELLGDIKSINLDAFYGCSALKAISLTSNSAFSTQSGILYNGEKTEILFVPNGISGSVTVPSTIKELKASVFSKCKYITEIKLEEGLQSIGEEAFLSCSSLTNISIPSSVKSIGSKAFYECDSLESITIPEGITEIGNMTFTYSDKLNTVVLPSTVTAIGDSAFLECVALSQITLPSRLTTIGASAFASCDALTSINLPSGLLTLGDRAFSASGLTEVNIPSSITSCGGRVFSNCTSLTSVSIPSTFTVIPSYMFNNCTALTSVTIESGVEQIGSNAFYSCKALKSITLPSGVKTISSSAFSSCDALEEVIINEGLETIGSQAFYYCRRLISITIPSTVVSISANAFSSCTRLVEIYNLSSVDMSNVNIYSSIATIHTSKDSQSLLERTSDGFIFVEYDGKYYAIGYQGSATSVTLPSEYKSSSYSIGNYAFSGSKLTEITLSSAVTKIGSYAFSGASITKIVIPDSVTEIGSYAFYACNNLEEISIGTGVTTIEKYAFNGCRKVNKIYFNASELADLTTSNYVFQYTGDEAADGISVIIGKAVKRVPTNLFNPYSTNGVNVTSVVFEEGSICTAIGQRVFYYNNVKTLILGESIETLEKGAFEDAGAITELILPSSLITIGENAFKYALNVTELVIPDSVKSIGDKAFDASFKLVSLTIGSSVEKIGQEAFSMCSGLESVTFKSTQGWSVSKNTSGTDAVMLESDALSDTANAEVLLTATYLRYYWTRVVSE